MLDSHDNEYRRNGYANRAAYLRALAEDFDAPLDMVQMMADLLGPTEDFDGLISMLEDGFS